LLLNKLNKKPASNKKRLTYISALLAILVVAWVAGSTIIGNAVRPPEIPAVQAAVITPIVPEVTTPPALNIQEQVVEEEHWYEEDFDAPMLNVYEERKENFFTFLIFGLTEGLNANTIMVAAFDADANKGYVISIPRDTRVDVQRNSRKIVSAYNVGRLRGGGHEGGVERLKYEVQTLVGFRPDFYVSIDYEAFIHMIDAVGGVEVYVPFHMKYDDPCQDLHIDISEGLQTLDGADALRFARYRRGNDNSYTITDYQRIEHQQQVIDSAFQSLLTPRTILRIPEFVSLFNEYVNSDLTYGELLWFSNQGRRIISGTNTDSLSFYTIPMLGTSGAPHWYEMADGYRILELINDTINPFVRDITAEDLRIVQ